jgi:hypothetical protein
MNIVNLEADTSLIKGDMQLNGSLNISREDFQESLVDQSLLICCYPNYSIHSFALPGCLFFEPGKDPDGFLGYQMIEVTYSPMCNPNVLLTCYLAVEFESPLLCFCWDRWTLTHKSLILSGKTPSYEYVLPETINLYYMTTLADYEEKWKRGAKLVLRARRRHKKKTHISSILTSKLFSNIHGRIPINTRNMEVGIETYLENHYKFSFKIQIVRQGNFCKLSWRRRIV